MSRNPTLVWLENLTTNATSVEGAECYGNRFHSMKKGCVISATQRKNRTKFLQMF
jgi:hypothetical protein